MNENTNWKTIDPANSVACQLIAPAAKVGCREFFEPTLGDTEGNLIGQTSRAICECLRMGESFIGDINTVVAEIVKEIIGFREISESDDVDADFKEEVKYLNKMLYAANRVLEVRQNRIAAMEQQRQK